MSCSRIAASECCSNKSKLMLMLEAVNVEISKDHVDIDRVTSIMEAYQSNEDDWKQYLFFDPEKYTRNLVDAGNGRYNAIILCWSEGQGSKIHDHANAHCFVKILDGELKETRYDWPSAEGQSIEAKQVSIVKRNEVCYMSDQLGLHRMENPSDSKKTVTLHIYCPPFSECAVFDQQSGRASKVPITFHSTYGKVETMAHESKIAETGKTNIHK